MNKWFVKRFLVGMKLGSNPIQKMIGSFGLVFISFLSGLEFDIRVFGRNSRVFLSVGSDAAVMMEVFQNGEYVLKDGFMPKTILDLGAHIGVASLYFSLRDPSASIVSVEPDPRNARLLRKNTDGKKVVVIEGAVDAQQGTREFYPVRGQGMSSSFVKRFSADEIRVKTHSIESLIAQMGWQGVDLIKFDIEGAEFDIFENLKPNTAKALIGEYHADLTHKSVDEFLALFPGYISEVHPVSQDRYIVRLYSV